MLRCGKVVSGLFGNRSAMMVLGPGGRFDRHSFTGNGSRIPFLDAEFSYNFSYIRGFDP